MINDTNSDTFSRKNILEKQKQVREQYENQVHEMRKALEHIASTPSGEKILRYLFLICGGDQALVRRNKEGVISTDETLFLLGAKSVYENLRLNLSAETLVKIERHNWESE